MYTTVIKHNRELHISKYDNLNKGRQPNLDKKLEEDSITENQRLKMANEYAKNTKNTKEM